MVVDYSEDREMLTLLRRGEISAFVDIYTTYFDALLNYADRLLNDMEAAPGRGTGHLLFSSSTLRSAPNP